MKITKMNGLGSFGVWIDDFDWKSPEAWKELEQLNLKYLVTVIRNNNQDAFEDILHNWNVISRLRYSSSVQLVDKYGENWSKPETYTDPTDRLMVESFKRISVDGNKYSGGWVRVTGELNDEGKNTGMFVDTELLWHSNGSGVKTFAPLVGLYGRRSMLGSSTGFSVSPDWLDEQTESFRSELEDLVAIHQWVPYAIEPTGIAECEEHLKNVFAEPEPSEMPLIMTSPGGHKGVHLGLGTVSGFKDMPKAESDALLEHLTKELTSPKWTMDVWWPNDQGDFYLFDNSITMHNRTFQPGTDIRAALQKRLGYRVAGDYASNQEWIPSNDPAWLEERNKMWPLHRFWGEVGELRHLRALANLMSTEEEKQQWWDRVVANRPDIAPRLGWTEEWIATELAKFY